MLFMIFKEQLIVVVGTLPPKERLPYGLDRSLVSSVGTLTITFRDASGTEWQRIAGKLEERPSDSDTGGRRQLSRGMALWVLPIPSRTDECLAVTF